ncbi:MAG: carbamoyl-phosphate synthase large subunit [Verrucomicrobiae bacterium]|nr:carbamoyl-phosphate synthase large subunit [Verrucomicrobiae bacterium]
MPKLDHIKKVLIIGSGPIIIGQACEFDYSGTQACKALRQMGFSIVLVNSNPATIMTDPAMADVTYIEPLNLATLTEIIAKERPDALLPNLGGQTALNLSSQLDKAGVLKKYGVKIIGVEADAIEKGEDRTLFKETMQRLGIDMPRSKAVHSVEEAEVVASELGYPVVVRPAYTMGGTGGGLVYNVEELRTIASRGLAASIVNQVLIEESVLGWDELEVEVVRDSNGKMLSICLIENIDPMGVHTGDSFCVVPMMTVSLELQAKLQEYAYRIVEEIKVIGGTNVQFAHDPETGRVVIIEINPRTSRSSALASKATGFPIAMVSAKLAGGLTLSDIPYWRGGSLEQYAAADDYVVVKFARWAFEKFKGAEDKLGTQMKAVGEVMSIGKTYKEAFQKAIRSLENGRHGLGFAKNYNQLSLNELLAKLTYPTSERQWVMYEALRKGGTVEQLSQLTKIRPLFIEIMKELVVFEEQLLQYKGALPPDEMLIKAKKDGFADKYLAQILGLREEQVRKRRIALGVNQTWHKVHVSGVENASYYYSTYNSDECQVERNDRKKIMVLGGGPNRIGQGIEFDYCCVHAAFQLRKMGYETIMVNCNPETVSTDYDTSDKLYFEPLTAEDVLNIYEAEKPEGVIVQFGGQTPLNLANQLAAAGVKILGTSPDMIDLAEDRDRFRKMMDNLGIPMPASGMASNLEDAKEVANRIGYPLMLRPSYVLGGRGMEIVYDQEALEQYVANAVGVTPDRPILIDRFLENAIEAESDSLADGTDAFVPAVMEHIELAGIHSGDSASAIPPVTLSEKHIQTIKDYSVRIGSSLKVKGVMNIQYAIANNVVYVIEANPRASRTVPLVSKVCNVPMASLATQLMLGAKLKDMGLKERKIPYYGVKEAVIPFAMFPEVDPLLGPEMRSTGEVLGMAPSFGMAYFKAEEAAQPPLPLQGTVFISVADNDKGDILRTAQKFQEIGFQIKATEGTFKFLQANGINCTLTHKIHSQQRPNVADEVMSKQIHLVINTPLGKKSQDDDGAIRRIAVKLKVPYITTTAAAYASVVGIAAMRQGKAVIKSIQEYHADLAASD